MTQPEYFDAIRRGRAVVPHFSLYKSSLGQSHELNEFNLADKLLNLKPGHALTGDSSLDDSTIRASAAKQSSGNDDQARVTTVTFAIARRSSEARDRKHASFECQQTIFIQAAIAIPSRSGPPSTESTTFCND